jgi:membrane-associated phospholipid phosphatase
VSGLYRRRWFAAHEGEKTSARERAIWVALGYVIGGLGYLAVNRLVGDGPFHHLSLPLDVAIPFVPAFVLAYMLVYVTPATTGFFLEDRAELYRTFLAFGLNSFICFTIFLVYPVEYPRVLPIPDTIFGHLLAFVHVLDRPVNCFPSHHISTSFTTFFAIARQNRAWGAVFGVAAVLVALSTVFVKQHYVVDVPAGIAVACLTYVLSFPPLTRKRLS